MSQQEPPETEDSLHQKWEDYSNQFTSLSIHQKSTALEKMSSLFQESTVIIQDPEVQQTRGRPVVQKTVLNHPLKEIRPPLN